MGSQEISIDLNRSQRGFRGILRRFYVVPGDLGWGKVGSVVRSQGRFSASQVTGFILFPGKKFVGNAHFTDVLVTWWATTPLQSTSLNVLNSWPMKRSEESKSCLTRVLSLFAAYRTSAGFAERKRVDSQSQSIFSSRGSLEHQDKENP